MTTETIRGPVRDLRGPRSAFLGRIGLSPASADRELVTRADVEKRELVDTKHRRQMQVAWTHDLPAWMVMPCFRGQVPSECLLGVDGCRDAKFCLKQRLPEYVKRKDVMVRA